MINPHAYVQNSNLTHFAKMCEKKKFSHFVKGTEIEHWLERLKKSQEIKNLHQQYFGLEEENSFCI